MEQINNKIIIYQVLPRLFGNTNAKLSHNGNVTENGTGKFASFTSKALNAIKEMGVTHIWFTGIIEHATTSDYTFYHIPNDHAAVVKGKAGSPYAIKDYYDVDPDLAEQVPNRMKEFEALVRRTHNAGMKVIIDFVPNHVARQYHSDTRPVYVDDLGEHDNTSKAFDINNNFYYIPGQPLSLPFGAQEADFEYSEFPAKATGNDRFDAFPNKNDWYETVKLNYGVDYVNGHAKHFSPIPDTWNKMRDILLFWASKGVDGFRCDMAEMVPVEFWNWIIPFIKQYNNVCFIAEVYNPDAYRNFIEFGHFDYLYDKVGLYDTLRGVICGTTPAKNITNCWEANEGIQSHMLNFLENHDEQRIASRFFADDANKGIPGMAVAALMNTNPVMLYFGQELGEQGMDNEGYSGVDGRTTIFDYWSLTSIRAWNDNGKFNEASLSQAQQKLREKYCQLLHIANTEPAIVNGAFYDLMYANLNQPKFNVDKQYAFLRKYKNELILVVANFDKNDQTINIRIPDEAFRSLDFQDNKAATLTDLCTQENCISTLTTAWPFKVTISGYDYKILKFTYHV